MLFFDTKNIDTAWSTAKSLFDKGELNAVECMKVSTEKKNERASNNNSSVLILYCNNSSNEVAILN